MFKIIFFTILWLVVACGSSDEENNETNSNNGTISNNGTTSNNGTISNNGTSSENNDSNCPDGQIELYDEGCVESCTMHSDCGEEGVCRGETSEEYGCSASFGDQFEAAKMLWESKAIVNYSFVIAGEDEGQPESYLHLVEDGALVSITDLQTNEAVPLDEENKNNTLDIAFISVLFSGIDRTNRVVVEFDPTYGFPSLVQINDNRAAFTEFTPN